MKGPFHPVVLQETPVVLDLSGPEPLWPDTPWTIGRYDETRPAVYDQELFGSSRCLHIGIDLGGPVGTPVHGFSDGHILHRGLNPAPGDYGHVITTEHRWQDRPLYALYGHLSAASIALWQPGDAFRAGTVLGWLGDQAENGGWPPHVHFQLSWVRPTTHDLPGVVRPSERTSALARFPDPRLVLGPIY